MKRSERIFLGINGLLALTLGFLFLLAPEIMVDTPMWERWAILAVGLIAVLSALGSKEQSK